MARALRQITPTSAIVEWMRHASLCFSCVMIVVVVSAEQRPEEASFLVDAGTVIEEGWRWGPQVAVLTAWLAFAAETLAKSK